MDLDGTWSFYDNVRSRFSSLFPEDFSNHEVSDKLEEAGVIGQNDENDSEMGGVGVYFKTKQQGQRFLKRLNKYTAKKEALRRQLVES